MKKTETTPETTVSESKQNYVKVEGKINVGDYALDMDDNLILIDEEDDLIYVNGTYTKVVLLQRKHTPTPWTVTNSNNSDYLDIDGTDARICSIPVNEVELNEQGVTRAEAEANAQRIVTAVNLHDELVASLDEAKKIMAGYMADSEVADNNGDYERLEKYEALIAKANNSK